MKKYMLAIAVAFAALFGLSAQAAPLSPNTAAVQGLVTQDATVVQWHNRRRSHWRWGSRGGWGWHNRRRSHWRWGSRGGWGHNRYRSHSRWGSRRW